MRFTRMLGHGHLAREDTGWKPMPCAGLRPKAALGCCLATVCMIVASGWAQESSHEPATRPTVSRGHGFHPPMTDQKLYFQCRPVEVKDKDAKPIEVALRLPPPGTSGDLDQSLDLPAGMGRIRLTRYLPQAELTQEVVAVRDAAAKPALQVAIEGPTQSFQRWLIADDEERNRLISFIGTWRYMSVADKKQRDDLFAQFRDELTRRPTGVISGVDGKHAHKFPAEPGKTQDFDDLGCKVRVRSFFPHYALDDKSHQPVNQSEKRLNPAILVEIEYDGRKEERWVFARFPDFKARGAEQLPFRVALDCPIAKQGTAPDYLLVTLDRSTHEVWARHEGKTTARPIALEEPIDIVGSQYRFSLTRFVPSGRLIEEYHPVTGRGGVAALRIEVHAASEQMVPVWLELGRPRTISCRDGVVAVAFGPQQNAPAAHRMPGQTR